MNVSGHQGITLTGSHEIFLSDGLTLLLDERKAFLDEMIYFMDQSQVEQRTRLDGRIPNLAEYWTMRLGTCAVGPTNHLAA